MIAREIDDGTAAMVWVQSVTRRHWLRGKLIVAVGVLTATSAIIGGTVTATLSVFQPLVGPEVSIYSQFALHGPLLVADTLASFAGGLVIGSYARRTVTAMGWAAAWAISIHITIIVFLAPRAVATTTAEWLRYQALGSSVLLTLAVLLGAFVLTRRVDRLSV